MNSSSTSIINLTNNSSLEGDKTRRKRLKVVSACGECRRKKTKCNGEKPCYGCIKSNVECKYIPKSTTTTVKATPVPAEKATMISNTSLNIHSIEERLDVIESILRSLIGTTNPKYFQEKSESNRSNSQLLLSSPNTYHSDISCGDSPLHVPHTQNRNLTREKRQRHEDDECVTDKKRIIIIRDSHGYNHNKPLLAPINHQKQPNTLPGIPTIKNLLNDDDNVQQKYNHPTSAFIRISSSPSSSF